MVSILAPDSDWVVKKYDMRIGLPIDEVIANDVILTRLLKVISNSGIRSRGDLLQLEKVLVRRLQERIHALVLDSPDGFEVYRSNEEVHAVLTTDSVVMTTASSLLVISSWRDSTGFLDYACVNTPLKPFAMLDALFELDYAGYDSTKLRRVKIHHTCYYLVKGGV